MNNRVIACAFLAGAFIISMQRYFPTRGYISIGRMAVDVGSLSVIMTGGLYFSAIGVQ